MASMRKFRKMESEGQLHLRGHFSAPEGSEVIIRKKGARKGEVGGYKIEREKHEIEDVETGSNCNECSGLNPDCWYCASKRKKTA